MARVLITNTYNLQNMGEVLQVTSLIRQFPADRFTLAGWYSFLDENVCRELGIDVAGNLRPPGKATLAAQALVGLARTWLWREFGVPKLPPLLRAYADSDYVIDLGGDTFSDVPSRAYTLAHCFPLLPALMLRKPYVVCSQSIGPFRSTMTRALARYVLSHAATITARDPLTQRYLVETLGLDDARIRLCRDLAFQLSPEARSEPGLVGVNPSPLAHRYMRCSPEQYVRFVADVVSSFRGRYRVILIPHVYGPQKGLGATRNQDDRVVIRAVRELVDAEEGTHEDIARCDLFIGFRMHACISAITRGIPTVVMAYGQKASGLPELPWVQKLDMEKASMEESISALHSITDSVSAFRSSHSSDLVLMRRESSCHRDAVAAVRERTGNELMGSHLRCRVAAATNPEQRRSSASAGVATVAVASALKSSEVASAILLDTASDPPTPIRTSNPTDVLRCTGSIYAFDEGVMTRMMQLAAVESAVVVGLPCHVSALRARYPQHLYLGLFCSHRVTPQGIRFLLDHLGLKGEVVRYRAKVAGTTGLLIDRRFFVPLSLYWNRFFNYAFIPDGCLRCRDLTAEMADISVGDAWTCNSASAKGLNAVITRTRRGEDLVAQLIREGAIEAKDVSPADIVRTQFNYLNLKKNRLSAKLRAYRALRSLGNCLSLHTSFHPLLHLWLRATVRGTNVVDDSVSGEGQFISKH